MKISSKILSIPPYISTSWKNIASLHLEDQSGCDVLVITLHNGARIEVPGLEAGLIETIFSSHVHYLESEEKNSQIKACSAKEMPLEGAKHFSLELLALQQPLPDMGSLASLAHDPDLADSPKLPGDILDKIEQITRSMGIDDPDALPQPEQDCNCFRCQIARAMQKSFGSKHNEQEDVFESEEEVSDEEISFKAWSVTQKTDQLYIVTNPLEDTEQYQVHLGDPIGCTCGKKHCEHIKAVLST